MYSREDGDLAELVLRPALSNSIRYDRSAGYFSAKTLVVAADGIEALCANGGTIRLVVGCLTNPQEAEAIERGQLAATEIAAKKLGSALEVPPGVARDALELLAWLVTQRRLEMRVALPRRTEDGLLDLDHIFHQKTALFTDATGDTIGFNGSVNETPAGWQYNWESMNLFRSWDVTRPLLDELRDNFDRLWLGKMRTAYVVDIPTAVHNDLLRYSPPEGELPKRLREAPDVPKTTVSFIQTTTWRDVRNFLSDTPILPSAVGVAAATSAIEPWPHQWQAFRRLYEPWHNDAVLPQLLIADEVGLGKTIEAGLLLRQAAMAGLAKRVLVLVPKSLERQWQRELREKFALEWPIYDGEHFAYPGRGASEKDRLRTARRDWWREPFVIASSHLLRREDRRRAILEADGWDLVILDEAHHARRESPGTPNEGGPNRMLSLLQQMRMAGKIGGLLLLTATPLQTALVELYDLLALLGLPATWSDRQTFERVFQLLRKPTLTNEDIAVISRHVVACAENFPDGRQLLERALTVGVKSSISRAKVSQVLRSRSPIDAEPLNEQQREDFRNVARQSTPVAFLVSRFSRPLLRRYGIAIARREPLDIFVRRSDEEEAIYQMVEHFIRDEFQRAERIADRRKRSAVGFVLATYAKRLASSLEALRKTLERHVARLEERFTMEIGDTVENVDEDSLPGIYDRPGDPEEARDLEAEGLAQLEKLHVEAIINRIRTFHKASEDAKLQILRRALDELERAGYDQAIVFTQYTDTLDWLRQKLGDRSILCYSGRGGEYRTKEGTWQHLSRDDTRRRFSRKEAQLLICTDAAAEGLNLQTCGALVNYDLPWNPMRVEQRIGRIDRIGQPRPVVRIVNLYYDGTVETLVYRRLQQRINLFGDVIGKLQPILAGVATLIEKAALGSSNVQPIIDELDHEIDRLDAQAFDLDASVLEDLSSASRVPPPPFDLSQLAMLLDRPDTLPEGYSVQLMGRDQWAVSNEPGGIPMRVTSDRALYEDNVEDYDLWTPGSRSFPKLDAPRLDVHPDDYPSSLSDVLNETVQLSDGADLKGQRQAGTSLGFAS